MLYLNTKDVETLGINWDATVQVIEQAVKTLHEGDVAQPIKPYLRFRDPVNRIIAMPAFVGGEISMAGIKWIASFPKNIHRGLNRAQSMTILNEAETGQVLAAFNTSLVSAIRTASVSGLILRHFDRVRPLDNAVVGIIGFGPIGQLHLQMITAMYGDRIEKVRIYDIGGVKTELIPKEVKDRTEIVQSWEEAYADADVFVTCTVSAEGYIDQKPKANALLLNVSLRDFKPGILDHTRSLIVDDWEEVCREGTDIEAMHLQRGLQKAETTSIAEIVCAGKMHDFPSDQAILFNPMGMAIFDIAIATFYYQMSLERNVGTKLPD